LPRCRRRSRAIRFAAAAGDPRAIELLAWCALRGIGAEANPIAAYFLYGEAAGEAVPNARENQALVYEQSLSQSERQHVLDIEARPHASQEALAATAFGAGHVP